MIMHMAFKQGYEIAVRGKPNPGITPDQWSFALDDVSISPGECEAQYQDKECTFEDGFGSFSHEKSSGYPWMIGIGRTVSGRTPMHVTDHTDPKTMGFYAYADLSSWNLTGEVVEPNTHSTLRSDLLDAGEYCLRMWYFIDNRNSLKLDVQSGGMGDQRERPLSRLEIIVVGFHWPL